ncbi:uncharacterized protein LOC128830959 isoform X1 [Malaclemys terrapin pileata]|uniref:uncharacterized protein LOC128830959 isoform X1 n=1 Tax=Malaclemys terrapin pileata TaxID=2991368 RepID=UPI0023A8D454|nr:uncharacterized protein LOC128830959 isoform X1 [Malaclemys terrapin pileata]
MGHCSAGRTVCKDQACCRMRLWLLVGLAAALTLVAVARADPGDSTEVEDAVGEKEDRLRVRREDRKRKPPPSQPCPGCYSPLSKPTTPVRSRRQVEKQQQPRRRLRPESTWRSGSLIPIKKEVPTTPVRGRRQVEKQQRPRFRPGSLSVLRPAKVEDSEVRTRREVERRPQLRPGPRPNPPGHSPYNYGYMTLLASHANVSLQGPAPQGRGRRAVEGTQLRTLKPKQPRLPCSGCYSPLGSPKDNHQQERVKREGQKPQRARPTRKPTWNPGSGSILGMIRIEKFITLPTPVLHCPSCQGSVATGQDGRSAEGILSRRTRREDERPTAAKRKAKQRAKDWLYCAGCYSSLTLRDQTAPLREAADGGSSGD